MIRTHSTLDRRQLVAGITGVGLAAAASPRLIGSAVAQGVRADSLVIDLEGSLESIHPSLAYSGRDWSVVHAIYDSIVTIDNSGAVIPLAAETFETDDAVTFRVRLREGLSFHDGTPVTAEEIRGSWEFLMNSGSSAADVFEVISDVTVDGELEASIICDAPAPWLPAQIANWMMLVPPGYTDDQALTNPVGTGPYVFESGDPSQELELRRFEEYQLGDIKGEALADAVAFRIVPDAATRVADIATGTAHIVANIPEDFREEVEAQGADVLDDQLAGSWWIRIATDVAPFDDPRVRQALNHAVDTVTIGEALLASEYRPLGSIFPDERVPGYLQDVEPYAYDPDRARELLAEAGVEEGTAIGLEITQAARRDVAEAIAANLSDVGFDVEVIASDIAAFNAGWSDPDRPALRMATWGPLYEPHTLLSLVFATDGYLSRYDNDEVDSLIQEAAVEPDQDRRRELYEEVNRSMHEDPPVIFLWNLTATYGVQGVGTGWSPDGNEQIVPVSDPNDS